MIRTAVHFIPVLALTLSLTASYKPKTHVDYDLGVDPDDPSKIEVGMQIGWAPRSVRVAMATHPEYDDRFWRYIAEWRVSGIDKTALLQVDRDNVWRIISHAGHAQLSYSILPPQENPFNRPVWHTSIRADGGSINPVDTFLYLPDLPNAGLTVRLHLPGKVVWDLKRSDLTRPQLATSTGLVVVEPGSKSPRLFFSPTETVTDAATLLDSPILYGDSLHLWHFAIDGIPHTIAYWPLPKATPFDTAQFVDAIQKVAREAVGVFGKPPYPHYEFLLEDGAWGALEHKNSVTIGMPSRDLAKDPRAYLTELAHEFFHAWNLMRLYPEGRGILTPDPPARSTGLWLSEGVTMYYAEALTRRAGFPERNLSRSDLLAEELEAYYTSSGNARISPEEASARAVDTTGSGGDYEVNYYTQGRLIGTALDLIIKDSTAGRKGLDDLMRELYTRFALKKGFTSGDVEHATAAVCGCAIHRFFDEYVRTAHELDMNRYLPSIGLRAIIDTVSATDDSGAALPDTRIWAYPRRSDARMRVWIRDPASIWAKAGLHTGQDLVAFNEVPVDSFPDFRRAIRTIQLGQTIPVDMLQDGKPRRVEVRVAGYGRPRVRIVEDGAATPLQKQRRSIWLAAR